MVKVLIVCSYKFYSPHTNYVAPFIFDQVKSLKILDCDVSYFFIKGRGAMAYFRALFELRKQIIKSKPQVIHAHGGLCGFVASLQRKIPVVTTFHGSDINNQNARLISQITILLSKYNIFVSKKLLDLVKTKNNIAIIPCGLDLSQFYPNTNKIFCREKMNLDLNKKYVLFSKMFYDPIKNYPLAKAAVDKIPNVELLELIGYTREEVCLLMNACDAVIMTSFSEGSPQFIKEAMACNCPIVSVDVGDVKEVIYDTKGCFIVDYDVNQISSKLQIVLESGERTDGSSKIKKFDNLVIAKQILKIYKQLINE